jgi:hypothetical protein
LTIGVAAVVLASAMAQTWFTGPQVYAVLGF